MADISKLLAAADRDKVKPYHSVGKVRRLVIKTRSNVINTLEQDKQMKLTAINKSSVVGWLADILDIEPEAFRKSLTKLVEDNYSKLFKKL